MRTALAKTFLRRRYARTFRLRLIDAGLFAAAECASMWPAQIKGTAATFAVSIKSEAASSSLSRTGLARSSAWRVGPTWAVIVPASPAPGRAEGGEVDVAQVEKKMACGVWQTFIRVNPSYRGSG